jgi:hypothetical protein
MRLDQKKDAELAQRKGLTGRTMVQLIWLGISAFGAYLALNWLISTEQLTYDFFYTNFLIPRSVPEVAILAGLVLLTVLIMQFFLVLGYAIASPQGRERSGNPSPYSTTYDPMQDDYRH